MCIDCIFVAATDTCVTRCIYRVHTFSTVSRRQIHHFESTIHFFWRLRPAFYSSLILWIHLGFRIIKVIFVKFFQLIECSPTRNRLVSAKKFTFARDARTLRVKMRNYADLGQICELWLSIMEIANVDISFISRTRRVHAPRQKFKKPVEFNKIWEPEEIDHSEVRCELGTNLGSSARAARDATKNFNFCAWR